jgi:hypothetical protein
MPVAPRWRTASAAQIWITVMPGQARTRMAIRMPISDQVTACEQYIIRTIAVSNINIYLYILRPDRDSNAGPTA